ncbi:MAG: phosphate propanoyltransferase [Kiritimatiellae bacterium]|nr:phosphate propanoyltransferase [Kiritimatiellia bacterium]
MSTKSQPMTRQSIEAQVRAQVYAAMGLPIPRKVNAPNPLLVNVSARHAHLTQEAVEKLFGAGHTLTPKKWLYQDGYFAAEEMITLVGPRSRVISNLRILGPCRDVNQVELAYTDAIALGIQNVPTRISGDVKGSAPGLIMGPKGTLELDEGIIRAAPHVHMSPADAEFYGVKNGDMLQLKVGGPLAMSFDRIQVRIGEGIKLEIHIDTDEGNACNLRPDTSCELLKL